jgi:hypothetical protein
MMSKIPSGTRIAVEIETVEALVEEQFPAFSGLEVRPVEHSGWDNHTFRLGPSHRFAFPHRASIFPKLTRRQPGCQGWLRIYRSQFRAPRTDLHARHHCQERS